MTGKKHPTSQMHSSDISDEKCVKTFTFPGDTWLPILKFLKDTIKFLLSEVHGLNKFDPVSLDCVTHHFRIETCLISIHFVTIKSNRKLYI